MYHLLALLMFALSGMTHGEATYYHPSLHGDLMRDETPYDQRDESIAAVGVDRDGEPSIPLGTTLFCCRADWERCVVLTVHDTGRFPTTDLDLSSAAFRLLSTGETGRIKIVWWQLDTERLEGYYE